MNNIEKIGFANLLFFSTAIILAAVVFLPLSKKIDESREVLLTVEITDKGNVGYPDDKNLYGDVYLNSVNTPNKIIAIDKNKDLSSIEHVSFVLSGRGEITDKSYTFDGLRVQIGQKAELRSRYFAQGIITEIKYAQ